MLYLGLGSEEDYGPVDPDKIPRSIVPVRRTKWRRLLNMAVVMANWAACELYLSTSDDRFRADLTTSPCHHDNVFTLDGFDWDTVAGFARLQLATHDTALPEIDRVRASVIDAADALIAVQHHHAWHQPYAPTGGWDWGSNGRILANIIALATAHRLAGETRYHHGGLRGFDYLLGRNPIGTSFITGYGTHHSHRQRVRHFGHALDPSLPPPPVGSIAGGAASKHYPGFPTDPRFHHLPDQLHYTDEPTSETTNDICIRWNAALTHAAALVSTNTNPTTEHPEPTAP